MSWQETEAWIQQKGSSCLIETLSALVTPERLTRMRQVASSRLAHLSVAVEGVWDIHNALALVRSAEAFGLGLVHLVDCDYKKGLGKQTMRGSDEWMRVDDFDTLETFLAHAEKEGWKLAAACPRASMSLEEIPVNEKVCLFFGNEHRGLSDRARQASTYHYRIPMQGMVESLNLSVAGAISMYTMATRMRAQPSVEGVDVEHQLAHFLVRSLGFERVKRIFDHVSPS